MKKDNIKALLIVAIVLTLVAGLGATYAYFNYNKEGNEITLEAGDIDVSFENGVNYISVTSAYSLSDEMGMISPYYTDFTVTGSTDEHPIKYEIQIIPDTDNTLDSKYVKVYLTDLNDQPLVGYENPINYENLANATRNSGKNVYEANMYGGRDSYTKSVYNVVKTTTTKSYRLRVWLDESYTENVSNTFNFTIKIYATNDNRKSLFEQAKTTLASNLLGIDSEDINGQNIISGDNSINNYVWYSGKLWRIFALNNDGSVKLITNESLTLIRYNTASNTKFEGSYAYQWLNEDFLDTLYNYRDIIVVDSVWNATQSTTLTKVENKTPVTAPVGLINAYEYAQSYSKVTAPNGYLKSGGNFLTITPNSSTQIRAVSADGRLINLSSQDASGIRPVVNLRPGIIVSGGNGSYDNPYTIVGDISDPVIKVTKLSERVAGEYVNFSGNLYRITEISSGQTKITSANYFSENDTVLKKALSSSSVYGKATNTKTDNFWDYYLNNTWYNNLDLAYRNMIVEEDFYLGINSAGLNYKSTICATASNDVPINTRVDHEGNTKKGCERISDENYLFTGKIGVSRIGEMFAFYDLSDTSKSNLWTLTRADTGPHNNLIYYANNSAAANVQGLNAVRASMYLSSDVVITSGKGTEASPFEIKLVE